MPLYQENIWVAPLEWNDVFPDSDTFELEVVSVGGDTDHLEELYEILSNKYVTAKTRYLEKEPFIYGIRRELQIEWPAYLMQKSLIDQVKAIEIAEVMKTGSTLSNTVQTNDTPVTDADTVPISDLSTLQTNVNSLGNKLNAIMNKYSALETNYLNKIYDKADKLFRQILSEDVPPITYEQE